jgi:hypothetical protein
MISEALQQQVEPFVIRWACGDERPLAYIQIQPATRPNITEDMAVDNHLANLGISLSKRELLQRYGRTEYDPQDAEDAPAKPIATGQPLLGLANAKQEPETGADADYEGVALEALAAARAKNLQPVIDALLGALETDDPAQLCEALETIYQQLPGIIESAGADDETEKLMQRIIIGAMKRGEDNTQGNKQ